MADGREGQSHCCKPGPSGLGVGTRRGPRLLVNLYFLSTASHWYWTQQTDVQTDLLSRTSLSMFGWLPLIFLGLQRRKGKVCSEIGGILIASAATNIVWNLYSVFKFQCNFCKLSSLCFVSFHQVCLRFTCCITLDKVLNWKSMGQI